MPLNAATAAARLSSAPMMDWTDRHCRHFHRLMSRRALLYTEMIAAPALVRGGALHLLDFGPAEHPVAVQIGSSDPGEAAEAARMAAEAGYDEVNLNVGCPSDRVRSGCFGAVLMETPDLVARITGAMVTAVDVPVTVKCRIGVDDQDPETVLPELLARVRDSGVGRVTIHARKAWLNGLSPRENRTIPPLDHDLVMRMKAAFPDLHISVNGGIETLDEVRRFLDAGLDGVMVGRAAYHTPAEILLPADRAIFGAETQARTPHDIARAMLPYAERECAAGTRLHAITRHMLGLFAGRPGARNWRRVLSTEAVRPDAGPEVIVAALAQVPEDAESAVA